MLEMTPASGGAAKAAISGIFLPKARGMDPGSTGMTPPERQITGTSGYGSGWNLGTVAQTAPDGVGWGREWGELLNGVFNLSWGWGGVGVFDGTQSPA